MKDVDQINAIAEFDGVILCGKWIPSPVHPLMGLTKSNCGHEKCYPVQYPPPYLTSLDAIVPVCEKLSQPRERDSYIRWLYSMTSLPMPYESLALELSFIVVNATARQRCEALLRTIGKWRER